MTGAEQAQAQASEALHVARRELLRVAELLARRVDAEMRSQQPLPWGRGVGISADAVSHCLAEVITDYREGRLHSADRSAAAAAALDARATPFAETIAAFELRRGELDVIGCALAVEVDERFGRLFGFLNDNAQKTRPTLGLAASLAAQTPSALLERPLFAAGLLASLGDGPLPERAVRMDADVVAFLLGVESRRPERAGIVVSARVASLDELVLPDVLQRAAARYAVLARSRLEAGRAAPILIVAGIPGAGRKAFARAALGAFGWKTVEASRFDAATAPLVLREVAYHRASVLVCGGPEGIEDGLRSARFAPSVAVVTTPEDLPSVVARCGDRETFVVELGELGVEERSRLYRTLVGTALEVEDAAIDALAAKVHFGPKAMREVIRRAALAAAQETRVEQESPATPARPNAHASHLAEACQAVGHVAMDGLAQRLPTSVTREDLVVPDKLRDELDFAAAWIRHQRTVFGAWRLERRLPFGLGLAALFAGPPGTGKTLAAQVLAAELEMLAYRVDLAQVVSKFIGETEKNLKAVFDRARAAGAILFFDEADALFGKRSEVKEAHDRYANMEVAYLLQRIEAHDGVTVLATNRLRDLDPAFVRRFQIIADFPMPGPVERHRIWSALLRDVPLARDTDLERVAREVEISGGEIKNAVLAASFFAAREGVLLGNVHLRRALVRELTKNGKVADAERVRSR